MLKGNISCEEISRLIFSYVDDKLDMKLRNSIATHLRNCPPCMEKYRIIKTLFHTIKTKKIKCEKKFRKYRVLCSYCDNELSLKAKEKVENALNKSKELTKSVHKIQTLKEMITHSWNMRFDNFELNLEKKIIERLKNESVFSKLKNIILIKCT